MLVITRKCTESIVIGKDVELVVLSVQGQRVKLGIVAAAAKRIRRLGASETICPVNMKTCRTNEQMPVSPRDDICEQRDGCPTRLS
jgi:carbon storage regulator CsrA